MFILRSFAVLVLSAACSSALTTPLVSRGVRHHAIAARVASPMVHSAGDEVFIPLRRSSKQKRCRARPSSSASALHSASSLAVANPAAAPSISLPPVIVSPPAVHSTEKTIVHETTPIPSPTTTHKSPVSTPKPTTSSGSSSGGHEPSYMIGPNVGDGTFYGTGLGACGITNKDTDLIAAVSHKLFDTFPGYTGGNPNNNPVCGRKVTATYQGKSVTVTITDRCVGCDTDDLDFSPHAFDQLADESIGRLHGVSWVWA